MSRLQQYPTSPDQALAHFRKCYVELMDAAELVRTNIENAAMRRRRGLDPRVMRIQEIVAEHFKIPVISMGAARRSEDLVTPRHIAIYLAREFTGLSPRQLAIIFSRDRGAILHAIKRVTSRMTIDHAYATTVRDLAGKAVVELTGLTKKAS